MDEQEYQEALKHLREDWGSLSVDPDHKGVIRSTKDPTAGLLCGHRAKLFAEIINRALDAQ